jgi:Suppressor of fused protein (SUFU)
MLLVRSSAGPDKSLRSAACVTMGAMGFDTHLRRHFPDGEHEDVVPRRAGIEEALPGFRVRRIAPDDPAEPWIYVTNGAAQVAAAGESGAEYVLAAPAEEPVLVEMLAALASVNADPAQRLGVGSVIALGRPWIAGAPAEHLLVAPPYPFGAGVEVCALEERDVIVLWLLPITAAEARFVRAQGYDAFEEIMRRDAFNVADPGRASLV